MPVLAKAANFLCAFRYPHKSDHSDQQKRLGDAYPEVTIKPGEMNHSRQSCNGQANMLSSILR